MLRKLILTIILLIFFTGCNKAINEDTDLENRLMQASINGETSKVKEILEYNVKVDVRDSMGATPLMMAALQNHYDIVKLLLNKGANPNIATNKDGWTALIWAGRNRHYQIMKLLIERGANVNATSENGITALMSIIPEGYP